MKLFAQNCRISTSALIILVLIITVAAEIMLMRQAKLSHVYLTIIAIETLIVLAFAHVLGEGLGPRELAGGGLIVAGIALVGH
jgi:drug/metabolite transporter (DMT)-like permease